MVSCCEQEVTLQICYINFFIFASYYTLVFSCGRSDKHHYDRLCITGTKLSHFFPELYGAMLSTVLISVCLFFFEWPMAFDAVWVILVFTQEMGKIRIPLQKDGTACKHSKTGVALATPVLPESYLFLMPLRICPGGVFFKKDYSA